MENFQIIETIPKKDLPKIKGSKTKYSEVLQKVGKAVATLSAEEALVVKLPSYYVVYTVSKFLKKEFPKNGYRISSPGGWKQKGPVTAYVFKS